MLWNWRPLVLLVALLVYGTYSSSTPDNFGLAEAAIGFLLVLLVGLRGTFAAIGGEVLATHRSVPPVVVVAALWLLVVPAFVGLVIRDNALVDFMRDLIPWLYVMLPIFLAGRLHEFPHAWKISLVLGLTYVGISYSLRFFNSAEGEFLQSTFFGDFNYFVMDPAVIFSATLLLTASVWFFYSKQAFRSVLLLSAGLFIYTAIIASTVRAQIVLVAFAVLIVTLLRLRTHPTQARTWVPVAGLVIALVAFDEVTLSLQWIVLSMIEKTEAVGVSNARVLELTEVWLHALSRPDVLVFGDGWGSRLFLTTGGTEIRYTHNIFVYVFWKAGLIGLLALMVIALWFIGKLYISWRSTMRDIKRLPMWLAIVNTLALNTMLEPGFKMLSFGLVLCLVLIMAREDRHLTNSRFALAVGNIKRQAASA